MKESLHLLDDAKSLFAVITHPDKLHPERIGAIILNSGQLHHVGPNRLHVTFARQLAKLGIFTARIDQSGKGESRTRSGYDRKEVLLRDFDIVSEKLSDYEIDRYIIIGLCSGADDGLIIAHQRRQVVGLILLDGFAPSTQLNKIRCYLRRLSSVRKLSTIHRWILKWRKCAEVDVRDWEDTNTMLKYFLDFNNRNGKLLAVFTNGTDYYANHGQLTRIFETKKGVTEIFLKHASHTYDCWKDREKLIDIVHGWISRTFQ